MKIPSDASLPWKSLYVLITPFLPLICRLRIEGQENVPAQGGCIITCNHSAGPVYVYLGYGSPRQLYYMAKSEIFSWNPWLTKFLQQFGVFAIRRGQGDVTAIEHAINLVKSGRVLGMYPEGTRSHSGVLMQGKTGVARIAMSAKVPVVPAVVLGTVESIKNIGRFWRRPEVIVRFAPPIYLTGDPNDRAVVQAGLDQVMFATAAMMPPHLRGEWGKRVTGESDNR